MCRGGYIGVRKEQMHGMTQCRYSIEVSCYVAGCNVRMLAMEGFFFLAGVLMVNKRMVCLCLHGMPSLAIWKKDSSGCSISLWRTAECRGRDVSLFHLVTWVHSCLVVFVCGWFWWFCFVGWFCVCTHG